jgi:hypothetical protein
MKTATKEALLKSIEHWKENESVEKIEDAKINNSDCALCVRFQKDGHCVRTNKMNELELCPVRKSTGRRFCEGSPYWKAKRARRDNQLKEFKEAAKKERIFLESLLPFEN